MAKNLVYKGPCEGHPHTVYRGPAGEVRAGEMLLVGDEEAARLLRDFPKVFALKK